MVAVTLKSKVKVKYILICSTARKPLFYKYGNNTPESPCLALVIFWKHIGNLV